MAYLFGKLVNHTQKRKKKQKILQIGRVSFLHIVFGRCSRLSTQQKKNGWKLEPASQPVQNDNTNIVVIHFLCHKYKSIVSGGCVRRCHCNYCHFELSQTGGRLQAVVVKSLCINKMPVLNICTAMSIACLFRLRHTTYDALAIKSNQKLQTIAINNRQLKFTFWPRRLSKQVLWFVND